MNEPKRRHICYIITRGDWGGAQRYILDLVTNTHSANDISVIIGGNGTDTLTRRLKTIPSIQLIHIPSLARAIHPLQDFTALLALKKSLKQLSPDIIHLNSTKAGILGSIASTSVPLAKVVYTAHGWVFNEPTGRFKRLFYTMAEKYTKTYKDAYIILSDKEKSDGNKQLQVPNSQLHVIPNGIVSSVSQPNDEHTEILSQLSHQKNEGKTIFLTIANLYATKGIDILIDAIAALPADTKAHYYIAGDGPLQRNLKLQIVRNKLENKITLLGEMNDASALLPFVDTTIQPSRKEGLSYVLLESLAAGTPIITTEVGANREVLEACNGIGMTLVPSEDISALAEAIKQFLNQQKEEAITLPPLFTISQMVSSTEDLYATLLAT